MLAKGNLWKYQILAERMWQLSLDIASQGAKLRTSGKGIVIVAEETRYLTEQLYKHYEQLLNTDDFYQNTDIIKTIQQVRLLSVNGVVEMLRLNMQSDETNTQLPILLEALNNVSNDLIELVSTSKTTECVRLEIKDKNLTTDHSIFLMTLKIGSQIFVENIQYVQEVFCYNKVTDHELFDDDNNVIIRGEKISVIDCYDKLNLVNEVELANQMGIAVVVDTKWDQNPKKYAILVDDIIRWAVFKSPLGRDVSCKEEQLSNYTRACWNSEHNQQLMFMDWKALRQ